MLTIAIIGKNESEHLVRLAASVTRLREHLNTPVETIFIDSASQDDSVAVATENFDKVLELEESESLCASAGRYVATLEARYPWIFYVDGDMELRDEFFPVISDLDALEDDCAGCVGLYVHNFNNGTLAMQGFGGGIFKSDWAAQFGGAVILRRSDVLNAGNWNPSIYGKEESELYARLGDGKRVVRHIRVPMVNHYSEYLTRMELFLRLLYPGGGQGKVFYGFGQSVRALYIQHKFRALVKLDFEPYLFWLIIMSACIIATQLSSEWGILLIVSVGLFLSVWMRPGSVIRYLSLPLPLLAGWLRYVPYFRPMLKRWSGNSAQK